MMRLYLSRLGFVNEEILMAFWSRWKRWQKWTAGIVGALFALGVMGSFIEKEVPNVVGSSLPDAIQVLKAEGFGTVSVTDEHGTTVLKSHYADGFQVTAQAPGAGVKAKVSKGVSLTVRTTHAPASLVSHRACQFFCVWGLEVGGDSVGVGGGELGEGLFPVGGGASLDEACGGCSFVGGFAGVCEALGGSFVFDVADGEP